MINPNIFKKIIEMSVPKKIYRAYIYNNISSYDKYFYEKEDALNWLYKEYYSLIDDTILDQRYSWIQGKKSLANKFNEIVMDETLTKEEKIKNIYDNIFRDLLSAGEKITTMRWILLIEEKEIE